MLKKALAFFSQVVNALDTISPIHWPQYLIGLASFLHLLPAPIRNALRAMVEISLLSAFFILTPTVASVFFSIGLAASQTAWILTSVLAAISLLVLIRPDELLSIPHQIKALLKGPGFTHNEHYPIANALKNTMRLILYVLRAALVTALVTTFAAPLFPLMGLPNPLTLLLSRFTPFASSSSVIAYCYQKWPQTTHKLLSKFYSVSVTLGTCYAIFSQPAVINQLLTALSTPQPLWLIAIPAAILLYAALQGFRRFFSNDAPLLKKTVTVEPVGRDGFIFRRHGVKNEQISEKKPSLSDKPMMDAEPNLLIQP